MAGDASIGWNSCVFDDIRVRVRFSVRFLVRFLLSFGKTFLQTRHQVDHIGGLFLLRLLHLDLLPLQLGVDDLHQVVLVLVRVLLGLELARHCRHELLGHLQLGGTDVVVIRELE